MELNIFYTHGYNCYILQIESHVHSSHRLHRFFHRQGIGNSVNRKVQCTAEVALVPFFPGFHVFKLNNTDKSSPDHVCKLMDIDLLDQSKINGFPGDFPGAVEIVFAFDFQVLADVVIKIEQHTALVEEQKNPETLG